MKAINTGGHLVIVVGAGPAGMQVANRLSKDGHTVVMLNRDIKFGGLAEYGIFPSKHRLRNGLRKSYWDIVRRETVHYFGNITVGNGTHLSIRELQQIGAGALVFATGAQGTKSIGVEGEETAGVFHSKEVVYHYSRLPGFSERPFEIGQRVAVIGIGDVMVDIAHWLIRYRKVKEVTAIVRRGPAERKYNPKEIRAVCSHIGKEELEAEFARIRSRLSAAGQEPDTILNEMMAEFTACEPPAGDARMRFRFLSSPVRVLMDQNKRVRALEIEEIALERRGDDVAAVGLKKRAEFPCDTVIFAVGDQVDQNLGLPTRAGNIATKPRPTTQEPDDAMFQVYDETSGTVIEGVFAAGWARRASTGLVGIAKRDGDWCSEAVSRYLAAQRPVDAAAIEHQMKTLRLLLERRRPEMVNTTDIELLAQVEAAEAQRRGAEEFKFATNEEMLKAIRERRRSVNAAQA